MPEKQATVKNRLGIHARPSALLVQAAAQFESEITLERDDLAINGKSIMGVLMLAAARDTEIEIRAHGQDAKEAVQALGQLIDDKFGEE